MKTGVIIVDHGSRRDESNQLLESLAAEFARKFDGKYEIVEPAHMEMASPTIGEAYDRCVARGARRIICAPFFLGPGKHYTADIPNLLEQAGKKHPNTQYQLAPCLGMDDLMLELIDKRISESEHSA
jgi:sirohydrochlorin ferrochelatase